MEDDGEDSNNHLADPLVQLLQCDNPMYGRSDRAKPDGLL